MPRSARWLEEGPSFAYTPENQAKFDENVTQLSARPAEVGDPLRPLSRAGAAGLSDRRRDAARRRADWMHGGRGRGRRVVLHDVLHEAGRQVRAERMPDALVCAAGRRAGDRRAQRSLGISPEKRIRPARSRCSRSNAWAHAIGRRSSWSTTTGTNGSRPNSVVTFLEQLHARGRTSLTGCHLHREGGRGKGARGKMTVRADPRPSTSTSRTPTRSTSTCNASAATRHCARRCRCSRTTSSSRSRRRVCAVAAAPDFRPG